MIQRGNVELQYKQLTRDWGIGSLNIRHNESSAPEQSPPVQQVGLEPSSGGWIVSLSLGSSSSNCSDYTSSRKPAGEHNGFKGNFQGLVGAYFDRVCSVHQWVCFVLQPAGTNGPRSNLPLSHRGKRIQPACRTIPISVATTFSNVLVPPANSSVDLQPLTGTPNTIPPNSNTSVFLPKVGTKLQSIRRRDAGIATPRYSGMA